MTLRKFNFDDWTVANTRDENIEVGCPVCGETFAPEGQVVWPEVKVLRETAEKHWNEAQHALPKVYIFANGQFGNTDDIHVMAVAEDGEIVAEHICSSMSYARCDLHDASWRHKFYIVKFGGYGDGKFYDVVMVPLDGDLPEEVDRRLTAWIEADIDRKGAELREQQAQERDEKVREEFQ